MAQKGFFIHVTNMNAFGHLVNADTFNTSRLVPEMYEIIANLDVSASWMDMGQKNKSFKSNLNLTSQGLERAIRERRV